MILLEAPVFSLTREVTAFTVFVVFVIVTVILLETLKPVQPKGGQRVLPGEGPLLQRTSLPPELPADGEEIDHEVFFTKIEEFRNDFDSDRQAG